MGAACVAQANATSGNSVNETEGPAGNFSEIVPNNTVSSAKTLNTTSGRLNAVYVH